LTTIHVSKIVVVTALPHRALPIESTPHQPRRATPLRASSCRDWPALASPAAPNLTGPPYPLRGRSQ